MSGRHLRTAAALLVAGSMALTGCGGINPDQILITMDGQTKTVGVANFMCQYNAVMYDSYYVSYFGEDMWDSDIYSTGSTMAEDVREDVIDELQELYLMEAHKGDYGVELTAEETDRIKAAAEAFIAANSSKALKYMGAKQEIVEEYLRLLTIKDKMETAIKAGVDTTVPDEEAIQKKISYIFVPTGFNPQTDEEDEDGTGVIEEPVEADTDEESGEEESGEDKSKEYAFLISLMAESKSLEEICEEYGELSVASATYSQSDLDAAKNSTSLDVEVLQAADSLQVGQVTTDLIATDEGYYVIRLDTDNDEEATAKKIADVIEERGAERYDEVKQGYIDACDWSVDEAVLGKISFKNFYKIVTDQTYEETPTEEEQVDISSDENGNIQIDDGSSQEGTETAE